MTQAEIQHPDDLALTAFHMGGGGAGVRQQIEEHLAGGCDPCSAFLGALEEEGVMAADGSVHVPESLLRARTQLGSDMLDLVDLHLETCPVCRERAEQAAAAEAPAPARVSVTIVADALQARVRELLEGLWAAGAAPVLAPQATLGDTEADTRSMPFHFGPAGLSERALEALAQPTGVRWRLRTGESVRIRLDAARATVTLDDARLADGSVAMSLRAVRRAAGAGTAFPVAFATADAGVLQLPLADIHGTFEIELAP